MACDLPEGGISGHLWSLFKICEFPCFSIKQMSSVLGSSGLQSLTIKSKHCVGKRKRLGLSSIWVMSPCIQVPWGQTASFLMCSHILCYKVSWSISSEKLPLLSCFRTQPISVSASCPCM